MLEEVYSDVVLCLVCKVFVAFVELKNLFYSIVTSVAVCLCVSECANVLIYWNCKCYHIGKLSKLVITFVFFCTCGVSCKRTYVKALLLIWIVGCV